MSWWKNVRRRGSLDAELDAELRFHVERQIQDYVSAGLSSDEARRRVRLEFGGMDQTKEECRDVRPLRWVDDFLRDVRLGFRGLSRDRLFAVSVTIILALGIGTSVTMFSVLDAVVLRPLPYARPVELVRINTHLMTLDQWDGSSPANLFDWRQQSRAFADMTFYRRTSVSTITYAGVDAPQRAQEGLVGPEFFELLGTAPLIGRTFSRGEFDRHERVVVLSEGLWQEQFARSPAALGRGLSIDGADHVVVGVMPRTFHLPTSDTRFWRPYTVIPGWEKYKLIRDSDGLEVLGRLAPGFGVEDASAEMSVIAARLREAHPINRDIDVRIVPLLDHVVSSRTRRGVWLGFAAVLSLLAIACANVGGLLTARSARRRRELSVRSALGAGRARLVRQLLAEGVSLWAVASVAGVALASALIRLLLAYGPRTLPRLENAGLDLAALAVAFLGGLGVILACGTIPALVAAKADASAAFGTRDQSTLPRHRVQDLLVSAQIAGALILLVGAVLLAQSFLRAQSEDPGYPAENLLIVDLELPRATYSGRARVAAFFDAVSERIGRLPGVVAVGGITDFFIRRNAGQWVTIEGRAAGLDEAKPRLSIEGVTPGYFRAAGIDLVEGRDFEARDYEPEAPSAVIVSESVARKFWPGETAIGKRLVGGETPPKDGRWSTVVGVANDMRRESLDAEPILGVFIPAFPRTMDLTIRASTGVDTLIPAVQREIRAVDSALPVPYVIAAGGRLAERLDPRRFESQALAVFSGIALLLSAAGLYALLAYQVTLRTREIGIRSALGASRPTIVKMVLGKGVRLAAAGAVVGVIGAASAARVMQSLLYETAAIDPRSYAVALTFVLLIAAIAAWLPARRAAAVSPMTALRED